MPLPRRERLWPWLGLLAGILSYATALSWMGGVARLKIDEEMLVVMPRAVQLLMTGGDRNLAANLATIRVLITNSQSMTPERYAVQAQVQRDAAWLNPAHEDNYYMAAALLPWNGQLEAAQDVLWRAVEARPFDATAAFLHAFDVFYFERDPLRAAGLLRRAARLTPDVDEQLSMENMAARWSERSRDLDTVIDTVRAMADSARQSSFRTYLLQRVSRLEHLRELRGAADRFGERNGRRPASLDELVSTGFIAQVPEDPFGFGYGIDRNGVPVLYNAEQKKK